MLARLAHALKGASGSALLTVTTPPQRTWPEVMRSWQHLVKFLRETSPNLQYAACKEEGSHTGMKHLHVILLNLEYTPQFKIAQRWRELTGAFVVRVERLRSDRAHYYVAKYVSKDLDAARKHVTFSKGFPPLPKDGPRLTHVNETSFTGPSKTYFWTDSPGIVDTLVEGCPCFGEAHPVTVGETLWLRSLQAHSPPAYRAN